MLGYSYDTAEHLSQVVADGELVARIERDLAARTVRAHGPGGALPAPAQAAYGEGMSDNTSRPADSAPYADLLTASLDRSRERFDRALDGVTLEQANTRPTPETAPRIDSLTWLAWHAAREIDLQVSALAGVEPLWTSAGFRERFALPLPDDTEDWRHTPEQAALVRVSSLAVLTDYLDAAYALIREYLTSLKPAALAEIIDRSWQPPVTRGSRLASIIDDAAQHSGQAVYSRRLLGLEG